MSADPKFHSDCISLEAKMVHLCDRFSRPITDSLLSERIEELQTIQQEIEHGVEEQKDQYTRLEKLTYELESLCKSLYKLFSLKPEIEKRDSSIQRAFKCLYVDLSETLKIIIDFNRKTLQPLFLDFFSKYKPCDVLVEDNEQMIGEIKDDLELNPALC